MVKHQHHAHSIKLLSKNNAPVGPTRGWRPTRTVDSLLTLPLLSLTVHPEPSAAVAADLAGSQPVLLSIWLPSQG